jgi:hypothetical protein
MAIWLFTRHYHATAMRLRTPTGPGRNADDSVRRAKALRDRCASANPVVPTASAVHRPVQLPVLAPLLVV